MKRPFRFARLILVLLLFPWTFSNATTSTEQVKAAWQSVQDGNAIILMRHALAPGTGDPDDFMVGDCSTQRNLSIDGQLQAMDIGDTLRANGIEQAIVLSSAWCRCLDTARLLDLGEVTTEPVLNSFYQDRSTADAQTEELRERIVTWFANDKQPRILVTHQVNITALTGEFARSGEMLITTLDNNNAVVLARITAKEF